MQLKSLESIILISENLEKDLTKVLSEYQNNGIFILVDQNTEKFCLPHIASFKCLNKAKVLCLNDGEHNKSIESCVEIWNFLTASKANRYSVLINLCGGMFCDLGGFAASTYKRGIDFIHIPTTLLAQVDASIGGKLGINFGGFKNQIGLFRFPKYVFIDTVFLKTLGEKNLLSGFAEIIKHALIYGGSFWDTIKKINISNPDYKSLQKVINKSIFIKNDFVQKDPKETNLRKALNLGHTFGHAFESLLIEQKTPVPHGIAVAYGIICELMLSVRKSGFSKKNFVEIKTFIEKYYGKPTIDSSLFEKIFDLMLNDKKNKNSTPNFTLLADFGEYIINSTATKDEIFEVLNEYLCEKTDN